MNITPEMLDEYVKEAVPFIARMGLTAIELQRGYVKLKAPLSGNTNHIGTMYAGALFTLGEVPAGVLYFTTFDTSRFYPVVKEVNIKFIKLARSDVTVEVSLSEEDVARIESLAAAQGKADFVLEEEIKDDSGEIVALCRGVYQLRTINFGGNSV